MVFRIVKEEIMQANGKCLMHSSCVINPRAIQFEKYIQDFNSFITRFGIAMLNLESINRPRKIAAFLKLETFESR